MSERSEKSEDIQVVKKEEISHLQVLDMNISFTFQILNMTVFLKSGLELGVSKNVDIGLGFY